jgi:hypothetical protein
MKLSIDVDVNKLVKDITNDPVDIDGLIKELTLQGETECKKEVPVDTGSLRDSITSDISRGVVKTDTEYVKYVILGTSAHDITVKNKKVLSNENSGSNTKERGEIRTFGKRVRHPGTKSNNFPARALNNLKGKLPELVEKYIIKMRDK